MVYMYLCVTDGKEPSDIVTLTCAEERLKECLDLCPIVAIDTENKNRSGGGGCDLCSKTLKKEFRRTYE
jgi:hypothetical protein